MDDKERHRRGADARRKVLGNAWVDRADANKTAFNADWQDFITRCAWGEVWTRPHFDDSTRRVLVIGTMMAIGRWEEFRMHVRAALVEGGLIAKTSRRSSCSRRSIAAFRLAIMRSGRRPRCSRRRAISPDQSASLKPVCRRGRGRRAPARLPQAVSTRRRQ